jgi:probable rRNA maturation factor
MVIFRKTVAGATESSLSRFLNLACRTAGLRGAVHLLIISSREMRALNRRFRGLDRATDVLSFPAGGVPETEKSGFAGDIAISAEIAGRNARALGHTAAEELKVLALHGVLHLAGYDHERDRGAMARCERRLRRALHLPDGLIERGAAAGAEETSAAGKKHAAGKQGAAAKQRAGAQRPAARPVKARGRRAGSGS